MKLKGAFMAITILLLFCCPIFAGNGVFIISNNCIEAQKNIGALKLKKANQLLLAEQKTNPNNLAVAYYQSCSDFYDLITSQNLNELKTFEEAKDLRLATVKLIKPESPFLLYTQSEIHLQSALLKVFKADYVSAMFEFKNSYNLIKQNQKKFPSFKPNLKSIGLFKALLGTTPKSYKWMLNVAGLDGDYMAGMALLKQYLNAEIGPEHYLDFQAAQFYYTIFELNFGDKNTAWEFCKTATLDHSTNLMSVYLRSFVGSKTAHNEDAIKTLETRPKSEDFQPFYALEYFLGFCKLNRLDEDADIHFKIFVSHFKGKMFMKDAYKRLQWFYLLKGDLAKVSAYGWMLKKYQSNPNEEEKQLATDLNQTTSTNLILLKSKFLFDGGYYTKAEETIKQQNQNLLKTPYQNLEYQYRYARILQELGKLNKAIEHFGKVVNLSPQNTPYYFAPNSCLQMGYIYKKLGFNLIAKQHFNNVGKYSKAEYIQSLEVKAEHEIELLK